MTTRRQAGFFCCGQESAVHEYEPVIDMIKMCQWNPAAACT
ncbi:hypothetical protein [Alteribacillus persepolensis]|nr:hypothetical protein [Alteribacillus persepolensis]